MTEVEKKELEFLLMELTEGQLLPGNTVSWAWASRRTPQVYPKSSPNPSVHPSDWS